ncbi:MAG: N-acetylmuramic acid 6-phosphate etherase [Erysipelotrichaceae bacterium]|nr:N-acetylmuramic acid 6-phosphate etherase [Erysipelotrichaceae bacterium]
MRKDLARLETENRNYNTDNIDVVSTMEVLRMINDEDQTVAYAIQKVLPSIEKLTDAYINTLNVGKRVFYIGAGTSGRLAFIDAAELVPTYGLPDYLVVGIMAGGLPAMRRAKEYAEDHGEDGVKDLKEANISKGDLLIGLAASGRTPYVKEALQYAKSIGVITGSISCVSNAEISQIVDYPVEVVVGQEVVLGSTRMKSGTAQKLVLNMISTAVCVRTGRTYKNLTLSKPTTEKGYYRRIRTHSKELNVTEEIYEKVFIEAEQDAKVALVMIKAGYTKQESIALIEKHQGRVREALRSIGLD